MGAGTDRYGIVLLSKCPPRTYQSFFGSTPNLAKVIHMVSNGTSMLHLSSALGSFGTAHGAIAPRRCATRVAFRNLSSRVVPDVGLV
jgi:hypothetical protein